MEGLIIFIIFIVFSIIRSAAESGKRQTVQKNKRPGEPAGPVRRRDPLPKEIDWQEVYARREEQVADEPLPKERAAETIAVSRPAPPIAVVKPAEKVQPVRREKGILQHPNELVRGIVLSEILGRPRALKRHSHRYR